MQILLSLSIAMLAGLLMSRLTKLWNLPAVTAYLVAGVLVGPNVLGRLGVPGLGFISNEDVANYSIISDAALGFIAFAMGNEFRISELKKTGKKATVIAVFQALVATIAVDIALYVVHLIIPDKLPLSCVLTLGAVATATAPAATLMVVKQYKADGPLTRLLLPIVALDDIVGLIVFAISFGIAKALEKGEIDIFSVLVNPLVEVVASLALGVAIGLIYNFCEQFFHSRSKRMSISVTFVFLAVALSMLEFKLGPVTVGFSSLLVCMATGTVFCNLCDFSEEIMYKTDKWTAPVNVLFFVLSGAELDLTILSNPLVLLVGVVYIASRSLGKIGGAYASCRATKCSPSIQKYLGITLLPQAGVALGMAAEAAQLSDGHMVRNVVLFSVLVYELVGPTLTRMALTAAGEIRPEGRTNARVENKPEKPVSLS